MKVLFVIMSGIAAYYLHWSILGFGCFLIFSESFFGGFGVNSQ